MLMTVMDAGCSAVVLNSPEGAESGYDVHRDIVFDPAHKLALDVYTPKGALHAPVVVFFYGGAWQTGSRREYRFVGSALAAQGVVVVIPDYRKYPQVKLDGFMSDATDAVGWTRTHISAYGGAPDTIFLMGYSAGAQMGALLATDSEWLAKVGMKPRDLAGFIGLAGPYRFPSITDPVLMNILGSTPEQQRRSQPFDFVDGDEPPMLLLQGDADRMVNPANAATLMYALRAYREPAELHLYPGVDHDTIVQSLARPSPLHDQEMAQILAFIRAHSGGSPSKGQLP
ncbi:MAG TPA: alpha/beta hydrolase [Rhodanobacteraceae bacterium]|nr:alpha/beta hydrolase [Rhodanobacteraceae bacterium]